MSRHLPARPSLEYLRKEARELLAKMRRHEPGCRLSDAQHQLARDYGFASWPRLKARVEASAASPDPAETEAHPFAGTWIANLDASRPHPESPIREATLHIAVAGDAVTITQVARDASGREYRDRNTVIADGVEHPPEDGTVYRVVARWLGTHAFEAVATRDGEVVGHGVYELSSDGRVLTVSTRNSRANAGGWHSEIDQRIVFARAQPTAYPEAHLG